MPPRGARNRAFPNSFPAAIWNAEHQDDDDELRADASVDEEDRQTKKQQRRRQQQLPVDYSPYYFFWHGTSRNSTAPNEKGSLLTLIVQLYLYPSTGTQRFFFSLRITIKLQNPISVFFHITIKNEGDLTSCSILSAVGGMVWLVADDDAALKLLVHGKPTIEQLHDEQPDRPVVPDPFIYHNGQE